MNKILPLGSVVFLNDASVKLMIISRFPLIENNGEIGYFDYAACIYPFGHNDEFSYYFNQEDIKEVIFEGYVDENERHTQNVFDEERDRIPYKRFDLKKISKIN